MQIQVIPMHSAIFAASLLSQPSVLLRRQRGAFKNQQISLSLPIELPGPAAICHHTSPGPSAGLWQLLPWLWCVPSSTVRARSSSIKQPRAACWERGDESLAACSSFDADRGVFRTCRVLQS